MKPSISAAWSLAAGAGLALVAVTVATGLSLAAPRAAPGQATAEPPATESPTGTATAWASPTSLEGTPTGTVTPTATVPVSPTLTAAPTLAPSATPRPPGPTCRLSGSGFSVDAADGLLYWSTVRNSGPVTVTLNALQVGWQGPVSLARVLAGEGAQGLEVFSGRAPSPALVALQSEAARPDVLSLAPGAELRLGLGFQPQPGVPGGPVTLGPAVLYSSAGCVIGLAEAPPSAACDLSAAGPHLVPAEPRAIEVLLSQGAGGAVDLASLELRWPVAHDGPLIGLRLDEGPLLDLGELDASPAILDLARILGAPLRLAPGVPVRAQLLFARPVAGPPAVYSLLAATRQGCLAVASGGPGSSECGLAVQGFETRGETALARLYNRRPVTRTLSALSLFWPSGTNGPLVAVLVDGRPVWTGEEAKSPASLSLDAGVPVPGERAVELGLVFRPAPAEGGAIASGNYSLVGWLRGGCQVAYATGGGQPLHCSVTSGEWAVTDGRQAVASLANAGAEATLRQLALTWPRHNGRLTGVWLGATQVFNGSALHGPDPLVLSFAPGRGTVLPRNEARELRLSFSDRAVRSGYSAALQFDDPAGANCASVLVTSPPEPPECALETSALEIREAVYVMAHLENRGRDPLEVAALTIDWPNDYRLINLIQVALLDEEGQARVLWTGRQDLSPVTLRPAAPLPLLEPGARMTLRLQYGHVLDFPQADGTIHLTVSTSEGCQASFAPPGERPAPQQTFFRGVIRTLPNITGLYGIWQVDSDEGQRLVWVDRTTRFSPPSVAPRPGDLIQVRALVADGRYYATEIGFSGNDALEILEGVVTALGPGLPPAWLVVAGEQVLIDAGTEIHGRLDLGAVVVVTSRRQPGGAGVAETITVITAPVGSPIELTGALQEARREGADQVWEVDRYTVRIPPGLSITNAPQPAGSLPPLGAWVQVRGHWDKGEVLAEAVTILPEPVVMNVSGLVEALPAPGVLGEWRIRPSGGEALRFVVESPSVVDTRAGPALAGMVAHVRLLDPGDGRLIALRVRIDWPD